LKLNAVRKLLIVRLSSLGDILLTTPMIRTIKNQYPGIEIDFVLRKEFHDLLRLNTCINNIFFYDSNKEEVGRLGSMINDNGYDLIVDLQNNFRSKILLKKPGCPVISFRKNDLKKFLLVHFKINLLKNSLSIAERYAQTVEDFELDNEGLNLFTDKKPFLFNDSDKNKIGLCPGAKHLTKRWTKEYYIALGKLLEQNGYQVILFGGKDDKLLCSEIENQLVNSINLCNDNDILQTAADMEKCKTIFCNDSGLMHTAAAMKIPVIAFFGSTVKEFGFSPYKSKSLVMENNNLSCRPCSHIGRNECPKKHFKCMLELSPQLAFNNLKSFLNT